MVSVFVQTGTYDLELRPLVAGGRFAAEPKRRIVYHPSPARGRSCLLAPLTGGRRRHHQGPTAGRYDQPSHSDAPLVCGGPLRTASGTVRPLGLRTDVLVYINPRHRTRFGASLTGWPSAIRGAVHTSGQWDALGRQARGSPTCRMRSPLRQCQLPLRATL
ncbi:hypothetical protein GY45DRAFT_591580 [Cubamyces sp. BRFM 1775]|nr:hypothetical protein GY45DRAFT_591580 [Cubamyces sp. BRFM 1775]